MILQSNARYAELAEFDPATGSFQIIERDADRGRRFEGHYDYLDKALAILYRRRNGEMVLRLDSTDIPISELRKIRHRRQGEISTLSVETGDNLIEISYTPRDIGPDRVFDPTPFIEAEDLDFGLFVTNVLTNSERAEGIYREGQEE